MKKTKDKTTKQINRSYHSHMKAVIKGAHEKEIFDSLSAGKNSYLRLDRLASSSFDKSWIEVIEGVIFDLGQIISNPRLNTKIEGSLTPVELARKINNETVQHLASHTQYIKEIDDYGNVIPSKLLSMYAEDDIRTYENRFIATFVRRLMLFITKRYEYVTKFAELRNEEFLYFKNKSIIDGAEVEIETKVKISYKNDDEEAKVNSAYVERIRQTREYILYFYNSPFMKALKTEKDVRNPIMQTNIIRKNVKYHHCYEVYRFIETYDRLGVNYKIDENYSKFNDDEINELNRTLFANYITLKGKEMSRDKKTNTKVYKPRILTSAEDEAFIYGPLLEGPIEFARVDKGYQEYLQSKLRKDLPLHPTKKEKEYYEDEYAAKAELRQDEKQLADLLRRRQKEVNAFEKNVKNILIEREKARLRLIELEKETIRKEENDLLEAARREIIEAAKGKQQAANAEQTNAEQPQEQASGYVRQESPLSNHPLTFEEAALQVWPQLNNPRQVVVKEPVEEQSSDQLSDNKPEDKPQAGKKAEKVAEASKEAAPQAQQPAEKAESKDEPKQKDVQVVLVPSVSFDDAAKEIWPQLDRPVVIKAEPKKVSKAKPAENKQDNIPEEQQPVVATVATNEEEQKQAHTVLVPTVSFDDAAKEIWPQLDNPTPLVKQEQSVEANKQAKQQPAKAAVPDSANNEQKPAALVSTVSFDDAAKEIWPQLDNPKPLVKEQPKVEEAKEAPKQAQQPAPANNKVQAKPKEKGRLIKVQFVREDGTVAIIYKKAPKEDNGAKPEQPKETPKAEAKPQPKVEPKPEPKPVQPVKDNKPAPKKAVSKPLTFEDVMVQVWPQLKNPKPLAKEQPKVEEVKETPKQEAQPKKEERRPNDKGQRHSYKKEKPQNAVKSKRTRKGFRK